MKFAIEKRIENFKIMKTKTALLIGLMIVASLAIGQNNLTKNIESTIEKRNSVKYKHSLGSSLFMLYNFFPEPADYILLTYGYQLNEKNKIFSEFNTWTYSEPIGTYGSSEEEYPGWVRAYGVGFGYQRYHWKGAFTTIQATPMIKQYFDEDDERIQKGFQLYLQFVVGYRFEFFKKRLYVEPAYALKYWPIDTNFPTAFAEIEDGAPKYIFEPSLNFGIKF